MPRRSDTRERLLEITRSLVQDHGFRGFSYRHLAQALGIKAAAVHYHFRSKGDLGTAVVSEMRQGFQAWVATLEGKHPGARARLQAFFDLHAELATSARVSVIGILEAEYSALSDPMRRELEWFAAEVHGWLAKVLRQGLEKGELHFPGEPDDQATLIFAAVQGALLLARSLGPERYRVAVDQLSRLMIPQTL